MSASSDDIFYSAPESPPPNPIPSQDHHQSLSTPPYPNPRSRADQNQSPSDTWFRRAALSAGKVLSSVLGLSDGSSSEYESEGDVSDIVCSAEEKDEFVERIKEPKQGMALSQVEEPKPKRSLTSSDITVEELVMQETLSRKQSEKQINPVQSQRVESSSPLVAIHNQVVQIPLSPVQASLEIHSVAVDKAKKWSGENKCTSSSFAMAVNPNTSPPPGHTQQLPLASKKLPLNPDPNHCLSPGQSQQQSYSKIIPPVSPLPSPSPSPGQYQPPAFSNIIPPVNPVCSPSISQNQQLPSHSAPLLSPNASISCTSPERSSSYSSPVMSYPEKQSKPCSKEDRPEPKCRVASSKRREVRKKETPALIFDPMDEERSGDKRLPSNLKEAVELFSGDLDYKQLADFDLLDVLEMKGIKFEDPPWWPK